jgi:hypothetical protein
MISILSDREISLRCCAKNALFIIFALLVALVSGQEDYSRADLEAMTEVELKDICVKRGFQLVNDGLDELTKQDYIEAAQRCLAIEQEMNELLTQYPELADELEEEIKRMEKENSEKQAHVDSLETKMSNDLSDGSLREENMAFAPKAKSRESENDKFENNNDNPRDEQADDYCSLDDKQKCNSSHIRSDDVQLDEDTEVIDVTDSVATDIESQDASINKEDLTLTHIAIESLRVLVKNAQDDVQRLINLAIPVLQPLFNVGDAAWRQIKTLVVRAREVYEAYQATNMPSSEVTGTAETCDDSVYT